VSRFLKTVLQASAHRTAGCGRQQHKGGLCNRRLKPHVHDIQMPRSQPRTRKGDAVEELADDAQHQKDACVCEVWHVVANSLRLQRRWASVLHQQGGAMQASHRPPRNSSAGAEQGCWNLVG